MKLGRGQFLQGDCLELMREIPDGSVNLTFTSPPYNLGEGMEDKGGLRIGHEGSAWKGGTLGAGYNSHSDNMPYPEYCAWQSKVLSEIWRITSDDGVIFYNHKPRVVKGNLRLPFFTDLPLRQVIIWDRGSGFNHMTKAFKPVCEWILMYAKPGFKLKSKGASTIGDVWRIPPDRGNDHPAPFPVQLARMAIAATDCETVFDPFGGSGSVAIAAENEGRKWLLMERDPTYYEAAIARVWDNLLTPAPNAPMPPANTNLEPTGA